MKKKYLIAITLMGLAGFLLTGIILYTIVSDSVKHNELTHLRDCVQISVKAALKSNLASKDFDGLLATSKGERIKDDVRELLNLYTLTSISLISNENIILLADQPELIGSRAPDDVYVDLIKSEKMPFIIAQTDKSSHSQHSTEGGLIKVYEPAVLDGKMKGVFVLEISQQAKGAHGNMQTQGIVLTMLGGTLALFLLVIGVLYQISKVLLKQIEELKTQKQGLETLYKKLDYSYEDTLLAIAGAIDAKDPFLSGHSARVAVIALLLSKELDLNEKDSKTLEYAAIVHDIGMLSVPDNILEKSSKLTEDEYKVIKRHPDTGVRILKNIDFLSEALPIIRHHHEKFDGTGYPLGLEKKDIPLGARILALADAYDSMKTERPFRKGLDHDAAVQEIARCKGTQFDDQLVDAFMRIENEIKSKLSKKSS